MITQARAQEIAREVHSDVFGYAPTAVHLTLGDSATEEGVREQLRQAMTDYRDGKCKPLEDL